MIRIIPCDGGFRIQEVVTKTGLYITWPGLFSTEKSAENEIDKVLGVAA